MGFKSSERFHSIESREVEATTDFRPESKREDTSVTTWMGVSRDWTDRRAALAHAWSRLTAEEIEAIDAGRLSLLECLQARYGWTADESASQIENWLDRARRLRLL